MMCREFDKCCMAVRQTYIDSTIASSDHPVMYLDAGDVFMGAY